MITKKQMESATKRYNDLMCMMCHEYLTIGTPESEDTDGWNVRDMVAECDYWLSTYYESGHVNNDLLDEGAEGRKTWRSETGKLRRFIDRYAPLIADMKCATGHCSKYDN